MQFRKDLNGLRAIAVIAVVLFHFNASWMPGGFAGVDVFFVISGFLMTGIIFRGFAVNHFSTLSFYIARANRIIPALAALCLVLFVFGWIVLPPLEYRTLGNHIGSSIGFVSNIVYWSEAGYFDTSSHEKWLLHTWSLSVEWQFYLLYPLILVCLNKFMPTYVLKTTLLIGTILGFLYGWYASYHTPNAAYFLINARAWEMMLGGVAYTYPWSLSENTKKWCERLGLTLIIISYFYFSKKTLWPGYLALLPVIGSFLVIQAHRNDSVFTANIVMQKIGKWSYSIYLWHWPIVVALYYFVLPDWLSVFGIVLSVFLGFISYQYIEKIRFTADFSTVISYARCIPVYLVVFIGSLASWVYLNQGVSSRFQINPKVAQLSPLLTMPFRHNGYCFYSFNDGQTLVDEIRGTDCYLGDTSAQPTTAKTLLFGDSYAGHSEPFFDVLFKAHEQSFQAIATNWCTPSFSDNFPGPTTHIAYQQCLINRAYLQKNMHLYTNIIFAGAWDDALAQHQLENIKQVIKRAADLKINVFIMPAPQRYKHNPLRIFYRRFYINQPFDISELTNNDITTLEANQSLLRFSEKYNNVHFLKREWLYNENNTFLIDGIAIPYSLDGKHISILGAQYSAQYFMHSDRSYEHYKYIMKQFNFEYSSESSARHSLILAK